MVKVKVYAVENGPYIVEVDGKTYTALCRCGSSNNKPYCDGSHRSAKFTAKSVDKIVEV